MSKDHTNCPSTKLFETRSVIRHCTTHGRIFHITDVTHFKKSKPAKQGEIVANNNNNNNKQGEIVTNRQTCQVPSCNHKAVNNARCLMHKYDKIFCQVDFCINLTEGMQCNRDNCAGNSNNNNSNSNSNKINQDSDSSDGDNNNNTEEKIDKTKIMHMLVARLVEEQKRIKRKKIYSWHGYDYDNLFKFITNGNGTDTRIKGVTDEIFKEALAYHGYYKVDTSAGEFIYINPAVAVDKDTQEQLFRDELKLYKLNKVCPSDYIDYPFEINHSKGTLSPISRSTSPTY